MATIRATNFKVTAAIWNALFTQVSDAGDLGTDASFTPTGNGITYAAGSVNYKRLGRWAFVTGYVTFPATANGSNAQITNLPFTCENTTEAAGGCACFFQSGGTQRYIRVTPNATTAGFITAAGAAVTNATLSGEVIVFSFNYRTAS